MPDSSRYIPDIIPDLIPEINPDIIPGIIPDIIPYHFFNSDVFQCVSMFTCVFNVYIYSTL